eukprot:3952154-Prymnesium_polylepis.1
MFGHLAFASTTSKKYEKIAEKSPARVRGARATSRRVRRSALRADPWSHVTQKTTPKRLRLLLTLTLLSHAPCSVSTHGFAG